MGKTYDLTVSSMTLHHLADTRAAFRSFYSMTKHGGHIALADLDSKDGSLHTDFASSGAKHKGLDRDALAAMAEAAGFRDVRFTTACTNEKNGKLYTVFLLTADK